MSNIKRTQMSLDFVPEARLFQVYVLWSGIRHLRETHAIYCICTDEEQAIRRCHGLERRDKDFYEQEALDYWYEPVFLDHLVGDQMVEAARKVQRKLKTSE